MKYLKGLIFSLGGVLFISVLMSCNSTHQHRWSEVTYNWSSDNLACTAKRVCLDDASHHEEEVATSSYTITLEPTCASMGKGKYVVDFNNPAFISQTKEVEIEKSPHVWDEGIISKFPTIEAKGEKTFHCKNCDAIRVEEVDQVIDATNYTLDATKMYPDLPGVFQITAEVGADKTVDTIGIPLISKNNLLDYPSYETPAIIQGAAVNYEEKIGPVEYRPIPGATLKAPYSYFRYTITKVSSTDADGKVTYFDKLSGFDGTYYIIRVDVSNIIKNKTGYLHVKQENNKAMMVAMGEQGLSFADGMGIKTASYSLADNAKELKDTTGDYQDTPYFDLILLSSGKLAAGADKGKIIAPTADVSLSFYVDDVADYNPSLHYDPASTDPNHSIEVAKKFFDETKAIEGTNASSYLAKGDDLEIDVVTQETSERDEVDEYWSLNSALDYQQYNNHTIKLLCEVPVLEGLVIESRTEKPRQMTLDVNSFDIQIANHSETDAAGLTIRNNASLEILDHSNTVGAELAIGNNARMEIEDGGTFIVDEDCQLEVEYDAASIVHDTTHYSVNEVIAKIDALPSPENITEADSANIIAAVDAYNYLYEEEKKQIESSLVTKLENCAKKLTEITTPLNNGEITIKKGGTLINEGIVSVEGLEVKPGETNPESHIIIERDMKPASLLVEDGGTFDNYGCLSIKGDFYLLGTLNNFGNYKDLIVATDPDKGSVTHHKGIQLYWKDDVTIKKDTPEPHYEVNPDVRPGCLYVGQGKDKSIWKESTLNNYGDTVLAPGTIHVYGNYINHDDLLYGTGNLYMCSMSEAIVPIIPTQDNPTKLEERRAFTPTYDSILDKENAHSFSGVERVYDAQIELVGNGVFGELSLK